MGDINHLRMIANPFLLRKDDSLDPSINQKKKININHFLYLYIEKKYPQKYIPPNIFYDIINLIDSRIIQHEIDKLVEDIIQSVVIKFDTSKDEP
tara:strand:- start:89 stop:373 length:285 start_codon:yes stop_codon:yes gene_type:complete